MIVTWVTSGSQHASPQVTPSDLIPEPWHIRLYYIVAPFSRNSSIFAHTHYHPVFKTAAVKLRGVLSPLMIPINIVQLAPRLDLPTPPPPPRRPSCLIPSVQLPDSPVSLASLSAGQLLCPTTPYERLFFPWFLWGWSAALPLCNPLRPHTGFWGP